MLSLCAGAGLLMSPICPVQHIDCNFTNMKSELSIDQKLKCHEVFAIVDSDKSGFADRAGKKS